MAGRFQTRKGRRVELELDMFLDQVNMMLQRIDEETEKLVKEYELMEFRIWFHTQVLPRPVD